MKKLLPLAVISSLSACNPNTKDPGNSINEQQRMIYETRPHINKEENTIVTEKGDTLKGWRNKDPKVETRDSIYTTLAEQEGKIKEISQKVTIDGIEFSITVNNDTVVFKCSNINKIGKKYMRYDFTKLEKFYIARRKGRLSNRKLETIKYHYVKELLQSKIQNLQNLFQRDFLEGKITPNKASDYFRKKIRDAFDGYFYDPGIYYQTNNVPKRQNNKKKY